MSWKRISISIFLVIILLNIMQINMFLFYAFNSEPAGEDISSEIIVFIWFAEIAIGIGATLLYIFYSLKRKKVKQTTKLEAMEKKVKGDVDITSVIGYNDASIVYKVSVDNKTAFPLSDVVVKSYLSQDIFSLEEEKKSIPVVRPYDSESIKFKVISRNGEPGEADILGTVNYYNPGIDEYEEHILKPKKVRILWPELKGTEIKADEWEGIKNTFISAENTYQDIPAKATQCRDSVINILKEKDMYMVSSRVLQEKPLETTISFYAVDKKNLSYGAELFISAKAGDESLSRLKTIVYAENKSALVGIYHLLLHEINSHIEKTREEQAILQAAEKDAEAKGPPMPAMPGKAFSGLESLRDIYMEFDRIRNHIDTIEKEKIGIDSKFKSLYQLDELYKILAEDLVKRKIVDVEAGEERVKKKLDKKYLDELKRFSEAYSLLCEAETSDTVLLRKDFPNSGKKAILLVYFNAVEVYIRMKLKGLIPKGVTILLGENHGHINTRKKDWEKIWGVLSLGSCIHIINHNKYLFLKNEALWKQKVETLMHQVREMRNVVAHPSKENPEPNLVREKVYKLLKLLPEVLKSQEVA